MTSLITHKEMQCTPEQIEQKRKLAQQKLAQKYQNNQSPIKTCAPTANQTTPNLLKAATANSKSPKQFTFKPYEKPNAKPSTAQQFYGNTKTITGSCYLISDERFAVDLAGYSAQAIAIFKTIPTRFYSK